MLMPRPLPKGGEMRGPGTLDPGSRRLMHLACFELRSYQNLWISAIRSWEGLNAKLFETFIGWPNTQLQGL